MKTILLLLLTVTCNAYEALSITDKNINDLKTLEKHLYNISTHENSYDYAHVINFIFKNLVYKLDYTLLKIEGKITAQGVKRLQSAETQYTSTSDKSNFIAEVSLTYPILDRQEELQREKNKIQTKQTIINDCQNYFQLKAELKALYTERDMLLDLEVRAKSRKLSGVDSFQNWLKIINNIKNVNEKITLKKLKKIEAKEVLLNLVSLHAKTKLEKML